MTLSSREVGSRETARVENDSPLQEYISITERVKSTRVGENHDTKESFFTYL